MRLLLVLAAASFAAACTTPCDALVARPSDCGTAPGPANAWDTCEALRDTLSANTFDPFAHCVSESSCQDTNAVSRCTGDLALSTPPSPCMQLQLWGAACGLAPLGSVSDCDAYATGPQATVFACWVTCVTADGCPKDNDPRFATCGDPNTYGPCIAG